MESLVIKLSFFDAFFKVHFTRTSRLTYPIPLPTTVAGMLGSMMGLSRKEAKNFFSDFKLGASLTEGSKFSENEESASYILMKKRVRGVEKIRILNEPEYYIVIAGKDVKEVEERIEEGISYLPFGGQNDHFAKDWEIIGRREIFKSKEISNYAPSSWIERIPEGTKLQILPVMHDLSSGENFVFVLDGKVHLDREIACVVVGGKSIALYNLANFRMVGEWKG